MFLIFLEATFVNVTVWIDKSAVSMLQAISICAIIFWAFFPWMNVMFDILQHVVQSRDTRYCLLMMQWTFSISRSIFREIV